MAFCGSCGTQIGDGVAFCPKCGSAQASGTPAQAANPGAVVAPPGVPPAAPAVSSPGMTNNVAGALAYILGIFTGILFLVLEPYNKVRFIRFHAFQSIFLAVGWVVFWIAWHMLWLVLGAVTGGWGWIIAGPLSLLVGLAVFICWIFVMFKAYNNEEYKLPIIGDLAAKQAGQ